MSEPEGAEPDQIDYLAIIDGFEPMREEFDGYLEDLAETTSLADRRRAKGMRRA